jgi:hypothetical protein
MFYCKPCFVKINIAFFSYILILVSCSKSEVEAPSAVTAKLLKEIKIVNGGNNGPLDSFITAYEYNDKSQLIKKTDKREPGNYQVYEYNGDLLVSMKSYNKGNLVETLTNPVTISGNKFIYTFIIPAATNSPDTVLSEYTFDGSNMTEYKTTLLYPGSSSRIYIQGYTYTANSLSSTSDVSYMDGIVSTPGHSFTIRKLDDKFNPFSTQSALNKSLMGIGVLLSAHGEHNVLEATLDPNAGSMSLIYTYDADGFAVSRRQVGVPYSSQTYSYTR